MNRAWIVAVCPLKWVLKQKKKKREKLRKRQTHKCNAYPNKYFVLTPSLIQDLPPEMLGPFFMEFIVGRMGRGEVMHGDRRGEVGFDFGWVPMGFWSAEGDRVGSNGVLISVGFVEIRVLISVYGDWVLIVWVLFQWGFDWVGFDAPWSWRSGLDLCGLRSIGVLIVWVLWRLDFDYVGTKIMSLLVFWFNGFVGLWFNGFFDGHVAWWWWLVVCWGSVAVASPITLKIGMNWWWVFLQIFVLGLLLWFARVASGVAVIRVRVVGDCCWVDD